MSDPGTDHDTDRAAPVPPAEPLTGVAPEPDQPEPADVLPVGPTEVEHLVEED